MNVCICPLVLFLLRFPSSLPFRAFLGWDDSSDRGVLSAAPPACTFTSPEVASVGFTKAASEGGAGGGARRRGPLGRLFGRGNEEGEVATIERKLVRPVVLVCPPPNTF